MFGIGPLRIIIGGDSKDFDRALAGVQSRISGFSRNIKSVMVGLGVAAAVAGVVALTKASFNTIDAQAELAYRVGGTISAIQTLTAVGDKAGVTIETLGKAAGLMNMRLAEAARTGVGPAAEALRRVGLNAKDLIKLDVDERLAVIADRFKALGLTAGQQAEVLRSFGIRGQEMINLLEGGGDTIRQARKDLEAYGVALSTVDGASVEKANDALKEAKLAVTGVANQLNAALAPYITLVAQEFSGAAKEAGGFRDQIRQMVERGVLFVAQMQVAVMELRREWESLGALEIKFEAPDWASFLGGAKTAITIYENEISKRRKNLSPLPKPEDLAEQYRMLSDYQRRLAQEAADEQSKTRGKKGPDQDALTSEQRDSLNKRFVALQRALANEAAALDFWKAEELLKLKEFEQKKIGTAAERNAAKLAIDTKYNKDRADLLFSKLTEETATEQEILAKKHADQLRAINEFEAARTYTEVNYAEVRRKLAEKHALAIVQLQAKQYAGLADIVDTAMGHISQIIGKEGGAAFEIMKGISMATALVKGFEATVSAYAYGAAIGGPPLGFAMAGIAAAGVAAQIAGIARTKPTGSGGNVTAPAGGGAVPAAAPATGAGSGGGGSTLTVLGIDPSSLFSGEQMRNFMRQSLEFQRNGGRVVIA